VRAPQSTEFIIATIPTYMAVDESARLLKALRADNIPCKRIVVNQVGMVREPWRRLLPVGAL